jgi:TatD DNase family protein
LIDLHATVGCHPTSTAEIDSHKTGVDGYKRDLEELIDSEIVKGQDSRMVAIGEIGLGENQHILLRSRPVMLLSRNLVLILANPLDLGDVADYDRLHYSPADTQRRHLPYLLSLAEKYGLPMFLHSRHPDAHKDLVKVFKAAGWEKDAQQSRGRTGVVHSFTGSREEMEELVSQDLSLRSWLCDSRANW